MKLEFEIAEIDNKEYYIMAEVTKKDITYLFLSNVKDEDDTLIGKTTKEDNDSIIVVDNKEEEIARNLLNKKIFIEH